MTLKQVRLHPARRDDRAAALRGQAQEKEGETKTFR